jgi:ParB family transcriptional regulator, chromosome partitioning protein
VHAVVAGGRRLKALPELGAESVIPVDFKVPCLVEQPEQALETSLMENTVRAAMHPADEFVAMAELIDAGEAVEAVALRFVSERYVRQRLRLGKLAPELLDPFRAGEISLEVVTAFTPAPITRRSSPSGCAVAGTETALHQHAVDPAIKFESH